MWIWNVIQYLSRSPFSIQFPNRAPVVIYTDCGAVNFITRSKNYLSYQIEIYTIHWPPFAGHICKYSRCNYLKRKIFFWQKIFSAVILSGLGSRAQQSLIGQTMLVIAVLRILSLVRGTLSTRSGPCVLSVRFRSSYRRNVNCSNRVFLPWLIAKFHVWVSVMGPVPGPILTGHLRWLSREWCGHELACHWLIRTDKLHYWPMRWLARDHTSHFAHTLAAVISHLQWPHATLQCQ